MRAWTVKQLDEALTQDLADCQTQTEHLNALAIGGREIREQAAEFATTRRLTPAEVAILQKYWPKTRSTTLQKGETQS